LLNANGAFHLGRGHFFLARSRTFWGEKVFLPTTHRQHLSDIFFRVGGVAKVEFY